MSTKKRQQELQLLRDEALEAYLNREDFQYDLNADALYRQYKDRYQELGRTAMEDTMGQAAALTGGYANSYAQNVGQQAYQKHMKELNAVIPELYQLAYERYQDRADALYRTYQAYDQQERQTAQQLQWETEQQQKKEQWDKEQQWAREQWDKEQQWEREQWQAQQQAQQQQTTGNKMQSSYDDTYYSWLSYHQGAGQRATDFDPTIKIKYDNQDVSTGNIMTIQRVLGLEETGMWTLTDKSKSGGLTANEAWDAYTKGKLQMRRTQGLGDMWVSTGNIQAMERALRLNDDGIWSKEDQKAAGGMTAMQAWEEYQKGHLQNWRS